MSRTIRANPGISMLAEIAAMLVLISAAVAGGLLQLNGSALAQPAVPPAPTGLSAESVTHNSVALRWDDPEDGSISGYQVLRRSRDWLEYEEENGLPEFETVVDDTGSPEASYLDTSVVPRTRYVYTVRARNPGGLGPPSNYVNVETSEPPFLPAVPEPLPEPTQSLSTSPRGQSAILAPQDSVSLNRNGRQDHSATGSHALGLESEFRKFTSVQEHTGSAVSTYTETALSSDKGFEFPVASLNRGGWSHESNSLGVPTLSEPVIALVSPPQNGAGLASSRTTTGQG